MTTKAYDGTLPLLKFLTGTRVTWSREGRMEFGPNFTRRRVRGTVVAVAKGGRSFLVLWDGFSEAKAFHADYLQAEESL